ADETFKDGDVARTLQLLDSLRPEEGQEELRSFDWYYLWQMCHSERLTLAGNAGRVLCVAFSPNGRLLAAAGDDRVIHFCDAKTGSERASLANHGGRVASLAFFPHGERLASAGADGSIRIWDVASAKELQMVQASTNSITALALSPDGSI